VKLIMSHRAEIKTHPKSGRRRNNIATKGSGRAEPDFPKSSLPGDSYKRFHVKTYSGAEELARAGCDEIGRYLKIGLADVESDLDRMNIDVPGGDICAVSYVPQVQRNLKFAHDTLRLVSFEKLEELSRGNDYHQQYAMLETEFQEKVGKLKSRGFLKEKTEKTHTPWYQTGLW